MLNKLNLIRCSTFLSVKRRKIIFAIMRQEIVVEVIIQITTTPHYFFLRQVSICILIIQHVLMQIIAVISVVVILVVAAREVRGIAEVHHLLTVLLQVIVHPTIAGLAIVARLVIALHAALTNALRIPFLNAIGYWFACFVFNCAV